MSTTTTTATQYFYGVGKRKASTARAKYYPTSDDLSITVNKRDFNTYFHDYYAKIIQEALSNLGIKSGKVAFFIKGGGTSGQADAARLALAKALVKWDDGVKSIARSFSYLSTDVRKVLPKRPGKRKARKSEQWSKR
jgi:small subunit ribosomal protein S9